MGHRGNNPLQNVIAIIPARFASSRLPGKLLLPLGGKPMILHTLERAAAVRNVDRVIVATDDIRVFAVVQDAGGEAVMTSADHRSGSDRVAEVASGLAEGTIIVNIQGDEPMIAPETAAHAVELMLEMPELQVCTASERIEDPRDVTDPNVVKVVTDKYGNALYFSRSPIPFPREAVIEFGSVEAALEADPQLLSSFRKHTGLYAYRREFLLRYTELHPSPLEQTEMLEQLRILEFGERIKVVEAAEASLGIDTQADLERARALLEAAV